MDEYYINSKLTFSQAEQDLNTTKDKEEVVIRILAAAQKAEIVLSNLTQTNEKNI